MYETTPLHSAGGGDRQEARHGLLRGEDWAEEKHVIFVALETNRSTKDEALYPSIHRTSVENSDSEIDVINKVL